MFEPCVTEALTDGAKVASACDSPPAKPTEPPMPKAEDDAVSLDTPRTSTSPEVVIAAPLRVAETVGLSVDNATEPSPLA